MIDRLMTFDPEPAHRAALWEPIAAALRRAIILGELPAGLHLEEPALAEKFGVSRIPIREALARLAHEGLVRLEPRRGAFVIGTTEADIHDIYELRQVIEIHAARRVAGHLDPPLVERLRRCIEKIVHAVETGHASHLAAPDFEFHRLIIERVGNRRLLAVWEPIGSLIGTILGVTSTLGPDFAASVDAHRALLLALEQGDPEGAAEAVRQQLETGERAIRAALRAAHTAVGQALSAAPGGA